MENNRRLYFCEICDRSSRERYYLAEATEYERVVCYDCYLEAMTSYWDMDSQEEAL